MTLKNIGNAQDLPNKPKGKKILLVEDMKLFSDDMKMQLKSIGIEEDVIHHTKTLDDTNKYLFQENGIHEIGAILMDRDLKGKYTDELVKSLQENHPDIKIYSTSSHSAQSKEYKLLYVGKNVNKIPDLFDVLKSEGSGDLQNTDEITQ